MLILVTVSTLMGADTTAVDSSGMLRLVHADKNRNTLEDGELVSRLFGDVLFRVDSISVSADTVTLLRSAGTVDLSGSVQVNQPGYALSCGKALYTKEKKRLSLADSVRALDSARRVTVAADSAWYYLSRDSVFLSAQPALYFHARQQDPLDSSRRDSALSFADTSLVISSDSMSYNNSSGTAQALGRVVITGDSLDGTSDSARIWAAGDSVLFTGSPDLRYGANGIFGDSVMFYFHNSSLQAFRAMGRKPGTYMKDSLRQRDALMTGGDILFTLDSGEIRTVRAVDSASLSVLSRPEKDSLLRVTGGIIEADFSRGELTSFRSFENVRSMSYDTGDSTVYLVYGDTLRLFASEGDVDSMQVYGSSRTEIFQDSSQVNRVRGDTIHMIRSGDDLTDITSFSNVNAVYYTDSSRVNEIAGDTLRLRITDDDVEYVRMRGNVFGKMKEVTAQ
ncbi:MAG: hypothetical protein ACQEQV_02910 [Fibrobacterota bacterium]